MNHRIPITVVLCRAGSFNLMFKSEVRGVNTQSPADGGSAYWSRDGQHVNAVCDSHRHGGEAGAPAAEQGISRSATSRSDAVDDNEAYAIRGTL